MTRGPQAIDLSAAAPLLGGHEGADLQSIAAAAARVFFVFSFHACGYVDDCSGVYHRVSLQGQTLFERRNPRMVERTPFATISPSERADARRKLRQGGNAVAMSIERE